MWSRGKCLLKHYAYIVQCCSYTSSYSEPTLINYTELNFFSDYILNMYLSVTEANKLLGIFENTDFYLYFGALNVTEIFKRIEFFCRVFHSYKFLRGNSFLFYNVC